MSPFDFKLAFSNLDRIWVWLLKQSCRTLNLEQLLFLEIFEFPYKFESNLRNEASGNSVNSWNSASRQTLTVGELLPAFGHGHSHLLLRAGMGKLLRVVSVFLGHAIKPGRRPPPHPFPLLCFSPLASPSLRRAHAGATEPSRLQPVSPP